MKTPTIFLTGTGVTIDDVVHASRALARVEIAPAARERVSTARAIVDRLALSDTPVYGVNSALGANTGKAISQDDLAAYQERAVQARAVGVGPRFATDAVRAMLFTRASGMAVGGSGVSPAVLDALLAMLNAGVHPVVPSLGSIGAADLAPLSHLFLPLLGQGYAEYRGEVLTGAAALALAGLQPVRLAAKDGIALISANAATVGHAALVLRDCADALDALNVSAALLFEGFRANLSPLDPKAQAAHPAPGQGAIAARLTSLLAGSSLREQGSARRVQDPLSLRCVSQVHGAALAALDNVRDHVELELNSAAESPLVAVEEGEILSNGNFHVAGLALAFDTLGLALAQSAMLCVQRCQKLFSPALSDLPLQLTTHGPEHSGFATMQKTQLALYGTIRHLANPASLDCFPVSEMVEDHASMASHTVAKTANMVMHLRMLAAIELLAAAQAVDLRGLPPTGLGDGARRAYAAIRARVPMLDVDRPQGPDIEKVHALIEAGELPLADLLAR